MTAGGSITLARVGAAAMEMMPEAASLSPWAERPSASSRVKMCSTSGNSAIASGVGNSLPPARWNSCMPSRCSQCLSTVLIAGCETCSRRAASVMLDERMRA